MNEEMECPFCGEVGTDFGNNQGTKWGYTECQSCGAKGPEVRTNYDISEDALWHKSALKLWDTRSTPENLEDKG